MKLWQAWSVVGIFLAFCIWIIRAMIQTSGALHNLGEFLAFSGYMIVAIVILVLIMMFFTEWLPEAFVTIWRSWLPRKS